MQEYCYSDFKDGEMIVSCSRYTGECQSCDFATTCIHSLDLGQLNIETKVGHNLCLSQELNNIEKIIDFRFVEL